VAPGAPGADRMPIIEPILALVGPTGTGKTDLSLQLAAHLGAEIVNCDSRQVYRFLDIGTAKPSAAERAAVPHHLLDVVDPDEGFDCARYRELARAAIADIRSRGARVVLVGGSGLYLKVLRYGLAAAPPADAALRARLAGEEDADPGILHARLRERDPAAAARLHPRDRVRLLRALEVGELTGRPLSAWQAAHGFRAAELPMRVIVLTRERAALHARLDARCRRMIDAGFVAEVRDLWQRGFGPALAPLRSIGYREIGVHLQGRCDLETAIGAMQRATRRLAKRQLTWFRAEASAEWVDAESAAVERIVAATAARHVH
jgi:tRNA dimethylallyltransferase